MSATTAHTKFDNDRLSVSEGIPAKDALNRASCLMAQALDISLVAADSNDCDSELGWALNSLLEMAKAYLDAAIVGMNFPSGKQGPEVAP